MDRIRFLNTNTSRVPDSGPTVASRATIMGGTAAMKAAEEARSIFSRPRSSMTGLPIARLNLQNNQLVELPSGRPRATFPDVAGRVLRQGDRCSASAAQSPPTG